jgi:hypothetical protein
MIQVSSSHINTVSRQYVRPFNFLWAGNFRDWVLKLFNKEDHVLVSIELGAVLYGNHERMSLNDTLLHTNGDRFLLIWKRGSHVMLKMLVPVKHYRLEEADAYSLTGGNLAILGNSFVERRK